MSQTTDKLKELLLESYAKYLDTLTWLELKRMVDEEKL